VTVIPAMDIIDSMLATTSETPYKFCLAIRAALAVGKMTINKYYDKTDYSEVYRIAMGACSLVTIRLITDCSTSSPSPSTQARIFQEKQLGR
jgi:hypothetical protein